MASAARLAPRPSRRHVRVTESTGTYPRPGILRSLGVKYGGQFRQHGKLAGPAPGEVPRPSGGYPKPNAPVSRATGTQRPAGISESFVAGWGGQTLETSKGDLGGLRGNAATLPGIHRVECPHMGARSGMSPGVYIDARRGEMRRTIFSLRAKLAGSGGVAPGQHSPGRRGPT